MTETTRTTIATLAARQHGHVARRQLIAAGLTNGQVSAALRNGRIESVGRGVARVAGAPATPLGEVMRDVLRAGDGARAVGERMLAATGVRDAAPDGTYAILAPEGRRVSGIDVPVRPERWPTAGATADVQGIPSYNTPRNLVEAAVDTGSDERVAVLADGVRRRSRSRMGTVRELVMDHPDHTGGRRLLLLGCLDLDAPESPMERVLETLLRDFEVRRQVRVAPGIRVDFLLADLGVVVEYDGSDHESGRSRKRDGRRDRAVTALGLVVVRVKREDLRDPAGLIARIHVAAARAQR